MPCYDRAVPELAPRIRPLALALIRDRDRLLVAEGRDTVKDKSFYRPLGGGIEPGERSEQTVVRELAEELGVEVHPRRLLGWLENIFTYQGQPGHEIIAIWECALADPSLGSRDELWCSEPGYPPVRVVWAPIQTLESGTAPLYPDGLMELLR